jgi:chitinase
VATPAPTAAPVVTAAPTAAPVVTAVPRPVVPVATARPLPKYVGKGFDSKG